jgi:hypothetical protein
MSAKRYFFALLIAFAFIFASDYIIHAIWLAPLYGATAALWRSDSEMQARMPLMLVGQFVAAFVFVSLWALGFARRASLGLALVYGLLMGLFSEVDTIIQYVVAPLPLEIAIRWFFSGLGQAIVVALLVHAIASRAEHEHGME